MDANLQTKFRIIWTEDPREGRKYSILVPRTMADGGMLQYQSIKSKEDGTILTPPLILKRVMGWTHYLILQFDAQQQYLDLLKPDPKAGFKFAGFMSKEAEGPAARGFIDAEAMVDGLKRFAVLSAADAPALAEVPKRVVAHAGNKLYTVV